MLDQVCVDYRVEACIQLASERYRNWRSRRVSIQVIVDTVVHVVIHVIVAPRYCQRPILRADCDKNGWTAYHRVLYSRVNL